MMYLTGKLAFGVFCELNTRGAWNIPTRDFQNNDIFKLIDSENSPFGDYGIESGKIVPGREYALFNVANHVRAFVDLVYNLEFETLKDAYELYIADGKARKDIFMLVYGKLRNTADFPEINKFMESEFGNAWYSYIDSVHSVAEKLSQDNNLTNAMGYDVSDKVPNYIRKAMGRDEEVVEELCSPEELQEDVEEVQTEEMEDLQESES